MARQCRVGLVAEPDFPQGTAHWLADKLPEVLSGDRGWEIEVVVDPVAAGEHEVLDILQAISRHASENGWDYAIGLTDLPLRRGRHPILAEINRDDGVAVMALPALGALQPHRRTRQLATQILDELTAASEQVGDEPGTSRQQLQSRSTRLFAPVERTETSTEQDKTDVRYYSSRRRGRVRLLTGMVRTNRPWRLIFGMSSALAAAVAASVFGLSSSTIWQIAYQLGPLREAVAAIGSVGVLVVWLIASHHLWEGPSRNGLAHDREQARLYNASTVITLTIGVGCMYLGLFVINLGLAVFLIPMPLLSSLISSSAAQPGTYVALAWGFTTMGIIAGALGSSLESDHAVRQAAYGYREQQRRAEKDPTPASGGRSNADAGSRARTKDQLYAEAQRLDIPGRSEMSKQQLRDAVQRADR